MAVAALHARAALEFLFGRPVIVSCRLRLSLAVAVQQQAGTGAVCALFCNCFRGCFFCLVCVERCLRVVCVFGALCTANPNMLLTVAPMESCST